VVVKPKPGLRRLMVFVSIARSRGISQGSALSPNGHVESATPAETPSTPLGIVPMGMARRPLGLATRELDLGLPAPRREASPKGVAKLVAAEVAVALGPWVSAVRKGPNL
jgi:hypothetical protein